MREISMSYKKVGWILTIVWLVFIGWYVNSFWSVFSDPDFEPNEFGDFLAGTFAPLAFLWLVIGYFQQGEELKQNTQAINLQSKELNASVEQQKLLAKTTEKELEHLQEQAAFDRKERKKAAQPLFIFRRLVAADDKSNTMEFINYGKAVTKVTVTADCSDKSLSNNIKITPDTGFELWTPGIDNAKRVTLFFEAKQRTPEILVIFTFHFIDAVDEGSSMQVTASFDEHSGHLSGFSII